MIQPKVFGKFILLERVGVGGMAEVYRAKLLDSPNSERFFAIKRILPHLAEDKEFSTMFINEARVAVDLEHPNVCQIYELGRLGQSHYIAMEYIAGRDVQAIQAHYRKQKKIMSVSQACFIIAQAAQGLDYAHRAIEGLVHRDVSPQNLLVTYDGVVKLIDFGVSKASRKATHSQNGVVKGKFSYMSPEQATDGEVDHRSDIFALGVVFWELLTGRRLFQSESEFAIMEMISECKIESPTKFNRTIPDMVEKICMRALEKDVTKRYQTCGELVLDLFDFIKSCKTPFTQWHLQTWMCKGFESDFQAEWEKIPIFKSINTTEDIAKYNREHSPTVSEGASIGEARTEDASALPESVLLGDSASKSEVDSKDGSQSGAVKVEDGTPSMPPVPGRGPRASQSAIPSVKSIQLSAEMADKKEDGLEAPRLSISAASIEPEEEVELEPEGVGPTVSDPQLLQLKRAQRKTKTRKGLMAFIIVISILFTLSPVVILGGLVSLPKPEVNLPTSASVHLEIVPVSEETEVNLYAEPKNLDKGPLHTKKGARIEFKNLKAGAYVIDVNMPGYEPESYKVALKNGNYDTRLEMTRALPQMTEYTLNITPEDARVYVNDIAMTEIGSRRTFKGVVGSELSLRVVKVGYTSETQVIKLDEGMEFDFNLEEAGPVGINFLSSPSGCDVYVKEKNRFARRGTTPMVLSNVNTSEPLEVEVRKSGHETWHRTIDFNTIENTMDIRIFADMKAK